VPAQLARQGQALSYDELTRLAADAKPFQFIIDPDFSGFMHPDDMPDTIRIIVPIRGSRFPRTRAKSSARSWKALRLSTAGYWIAWKKLPVPITTGCIYWRRHPEPLIKPVQCRCQQRTCLTGPVEATALGNVLMQAVALGHVESLEHARKLVCTSFPLRYTNPDKRRPGMKPMKGCWQ